MIRIFQKKITNRELSFEPNDLIIIKYSIIKNFINEDNQLGYGIIL